MSIDFPALGITILTIGGMQVSAGAIIICLLLLSIALPLFVSMRFSRRSDDARGEVSTLLRTQAELHGRISALTETLSNKQSEMSQHLNQRLDGMSQRLGATLTEQTKSTHDNLSKLQERLAVIDAAQSNIQTLARDVVGLQAILSNKQTRGAFGQARMETIIADAMPSNAYALQPTLSNGSRPDCTVRMPNNAPPLVIDAKFPLEAWNSMREETSPEVRKLAAQQFRRDMEVHIRDIAEKYLLAGETQDTAFLFVPSESIFADIHQHFEAIVQKAHRMRVVIVSPSLLMLSVQVIQSVLKDQRMREQAHLIQGEVALLMDDLNRLDDRTRKLQGHFLAAQKDVDLIMTSADKLTKRGNKIEALDFGGDIPEQPQAPSPQSLESRIGSLKFRVVDDE
ncbi:DNA recombination protein RmuC [Rhizobium sp. BIGb0125]|uniref:DNA recombination protein RmuC n=1 Tax=Rhizobium sp. BIGb0125 TaxID=2940618 RepID=UPI0021680448|nr:DNA recombination protein RmuC [Rhizobium sp. BIGb0125]MCS4243858.1 DNA recombination protein RmuC [Rhizobium sp. BIGb0125]